MTFEFATARQIRFGPGVLKEVPQTAAALGRRVLLVTGRSPNRARPFFQALEAVGLEPVLFPVPGEPTTRDVMLGRQTARDEGTDLVISLGGGSAIDAGKAIAALVTNPGEVSDYLEVVGRGRPIEHAPAPFIAIPTTAGTGTEVTRNAVLAVPEHRVKASLRSPLMLPHRAVVDPELTYDLPPTITAATGLDALTQLIEPFVSVRANPMTDAICREGIRAAARSLRAAYRFAATLTRDPNQPGDDARAARTDMALAGLLSGMALANAGLGAVHGFAAPIGGMFAAPHGAVCAALLPHVMEMNVRAARARDPGGDTLRRYAEVARLVTGRDQANADDGVAWVGELVRELEIPVLGRHGVGRQHVDELVEKAGHASSMKGNPVALTREELAEILTRAI